MTEQMIRSIAMLSARNQLAAVVKSVKLGNVKAVIKSTEVLIDKS